MLVGILLGIVSMVVAGGFAWLVLVIVQVGKVLRETIVALQKTTVAFSKAAQSAELSDAQLAATRRMITSLERMDGSIRNFTLLLTNGAPAAVEADGSYVPPVAAPRVPVMPGRTPPPPAVPSWEEFAQEKDAAIFHQTDEEMAQAEAEAEARENGIELDPLKAVLPNPEQIKYVES